jgi:phosphate transport system protein
MRDGYRKRLETLHTELIRMGALCEDAIASAARGLLDELPEYREKAIKLESEIDAYEREIEALCVKLLFREQPVAGDLRQITSAHKIITDMERKATRPPTSRRYPPSWLAAPSRATSTSPTWPGQP